MNTERSAFMQAGPQALGKIYDTLAEREALQLDSLDYSKTALIVVDMVNGFARAGALYSPRIAALIPAIAELSTACARRNIPQLAFADTHPENSPEFLSYPPHCLAGSEESQLVPELQAAGPFMLIPKNSTNGFLEPAFQDWLAEYQQRDTFIVVGDCTDICIEQFATTLKCSFNRQNRPARVIVPMNLVDTYDFGIHRGDLLHAMALMLMIGNGIEVVKEVAYV